ncbi:hypothetical protein PIB30_021688 [Stylosanthes scabra]|uniref:Uncharacterized protein n=1 Tax=Stylosanthes scabra TaxID=79078 RepID=A0ABU6Q9A0_9FABA|nr:hypothetical protein [Stylosanthes scabra]
MGKKKSCQNVKVPRPLNAAEQELYGWIEEAIFTQPFVVLGDSLPELRRTMRLTEDAAAEGDFMLDAAGPSNRLPFRADRDEGGDDAVPSDGEPTPPKRLGLLRTFEKVCLHFGFRPTNRLFLYIYDILIPPTGYGFISFGVRQGCKLFGIFEESIQEFKWHYFKLLPTPGRRAFWLDDEGSPFPWVYWNSEVKDFVVYNLDPLEKAAFNFLVSLPTGLPKKNNFTCRWILHNNDADVGRFLDDLLLVKMKKTKLDRMMAMMADPLRMAPRAILPTGSTSATAAVAVTAASSTVVVAPSVNPATPAAHVPPPPPTSSKVKKGSSKSECPEVVNVEEEEGAKEDPAVDLRQKRRRKEKGKEEDFGKCTESFK